MPREAAEWRINMNVYEAITARRTIRKFRQEPLQHYDLIKIIDCARLAPFGANLQPLKYMIIDDKAALEKIYPMTKWAGYLPAWQPAENERPTAYIAVLNDTSIKPTEKSECDSGAAIMSMILEAQELGIGSCWLGAIDRAGIKKLLGIEDKLDVVYLLALGYPAQEGDVFEMRDDDVHYYFDDEGNVCVPKRKISDIIVK